MVRLKEVEQQEIGLELCLKFQFLMVRLKDR